MSVEGQFTVMISPKTSNRQYIYCPKSKRLADLLDEKLIFSHTFFHRPPCCSTASKFAAIIIRIMSGCARSGPLFTGLYIIQTDKKWPTRDGRCPTVSTTEMCARMRSAPRERTEPPGLGCTCRCLCVSAAARALCPPRDAAACAPASSRRAPHLVHRPLSAV